MIMYGAEWSKGDGQMRSLSAILAALSAYLIFINAGAEDVRIANDIYAGGSTVVLDGEAADDVFAAGETVVVHQTVGRNLYVAGRKIDVSGPIVGDAFGTGYSLSFSGSTAGRVYAAGYEVRLLPSNKIGEGARLLGRTIAIDGDIEGSLLAAGEAIALAGRIDGDVFIEAESLTVSPDAFVSGDLIYSVDHEIEIPSGVVGGSIVERVEDGDAVSAEIEQDIPAITPQWTDSIGLARRGAGSFFVFSQLVAGLVIFLGFPLLASRLRDTIEERPTSSLGSGLLAFALLIGAIILTAITIIGIPLAVLMALSVPLILIAGYSVGAVGWILLAGRALGRDIPYSIWARLMLALLAVIPVYLLGLIPLVGWLVGLATTLMGLGALFVSLRTRAPDSVVVPASS